MGWIDNINGAKGLRYYHSAWITAFRIPLLCLVVACSASANSLTTSPQLDPTANVDSSIAEVNAGASIFLQKCVGCHTVGKGNLSGPDLKPTVAWPRKDLEAAITRMEKSVGPMDTAEIGALADLLLSPDAADELESVQQQVALAHAATLEPGSADIGQALFHGNRAFTNRGVSCAACHEAGGRGGDLAVSLDTSFSRLGETALLSAIENPGFPLMKAVYAVHPVTKQESVHLSAYLQATAEQPSSSQKPPVQLAGMGLAAMALAGIGVAYRKRLRGVRASLVLRARNHRSIR